MVKKIKKMLDKMRGVCLISNTARRSPGRAAQNKKPPKEGGGAFSGGGLPTHQPTSQRRVEATKLVDEWEREEVGEDLSLYTLIIHHLGYFVKGFLRRFFQIFLGFCEVGFTLFFGTDN